MSFSIDPLSFVPQPSLSFNLIRSLTRIRVFITYILIVFSLPRLDSLSIIDRLFITLTLPLFLWPTLYVLLTILDCVLVLTVLIPKRVYHALAFFPPDMSVMDFLWLTRFVVLYGTVDENPVLAQALTGAYLTVCTPLKLPKQARTLPPVQADPLHPHSAEEAERRQVDLLMESVCRKARLNSFHVSARVREKRYAGNHGFYTPADLMYSYRSDALPPKPCLIFSDVDYYVDIEEYMSLFLPMIMYSFSPSTPCGVFNNTTWTSCPDSMFSVEINGSPAYKHKVWNYVSGETYTCVTSTELLVYRCTVRQLPDSPHAVVFLEPTSRLPLPIAEFCSTPQNPLCYLEFSDEHSAWFFCQDRVHISLHGDHAPSTFTSSEYSTVRQYCQSEKSVGVSEIQRYLLPKELAQPHDAYYRAMRLLTHLRGGDPPCRSVLRTRHITYWAPFVSETSTSPIVELAPPLAGGAVVHNKSPNTNVVAIQGRVLDLKNTVPVTDDVETLLAEFVSLVIPDQHKHSGIPLTTAKVDELQTRPSQRSTFKNVEPNLELLPFFCTAFTKIESYAKVTDPRNISNVCPAHRVSFSRYTYPLSTFLKTHHWYAFGKTPKIFSQQLHEFVARSDSIVENDYSRFDGTNGAIQSRLMELIYKRFYLDPDAALLHDRECNAVAFGADGVRYSPGLSTLSGSPQTSIRNTLNNAFVAYCAHRADGTPPDVAFTRLGLYGGDDGLDHGYIAKSLATTSKRFGLSSKPCLKPRNAPVSFLGRIFFDAWNHPDSFSDVRRHIVKLTLSNDAITSAKEVLTRKARSILATDPRTPLLSQWARHVLKSNPSTDVDVEGYWATMVTQTQVFPQNLPTSEYETAVACNLDITLKELRAAQTSLGRNGTLGTLHLDYTPDQPGSTAASYNVDGEPGVPNPIADAKLFKLARGRAPSNYKRPPNATTHSKTATATRTPKPSTSTVPRASKARTRTPTRKI
jgi:hypothetical protein